MKQRPILMNSPILFTVKGVVYETDTNTLLEGKNDIIRLLLESRIDKQHEEEIHD